MNYKGVQYILQLIAGVCLCLFLLRNGANISQTAMFLAVDSGNLEHVDSLISKGAEIKEAILSSRKVICE